MWPLATNFLDMYEIQDKHHPATRLTSDERQAQHEPAAHRFSQRL
jgi:hypothetical protein